MSTADLIGQKLGSYQIVETIGQGGMASVYRAYQTSLNRYVAIKVLSSVHTRDTMFRQRFDREAKAIAQLNHPNIITIYDFGNDEKRNLLYLVMEYVAGGNLRDRAQYYLSIRDAVEIIMPIARALHYAHTRGIIHRDLKPSNILLTETRRPLLTDFGLAKMSDGTISTESGFTIGTPAYMSPEQVMGEMLDGRSDIYSLAMVLYELLTGRPAFQGDTPLAVLHQQVYELPVPPRQLNGRVPKPLESVLLCALKKDRNERFLTADAFAMALENAMKEAEKLSATALPVIKPDEETVAEEASEKPPEPKSESRPEPAPSFPIWLLGAVGKVVLLTIAILLIVGIGGSLLVSALVERSISAYTWNWTPINADQPTTIDELSAQSQLDQYVRASTPIRFINPRLDARFRPDERVEFIAEGAAGVMVVETTVYAAGGALQVQIDEVNGLRPYVVGSIIAEGINRGLRNAFASAPVRLDRIVTEPGRIIIYPRKPGADAPSQAYPFPPAR